MNDVTTTSDVTKIAGKVKKAAIFRQVQEDYGNSGVVHSAKGYENADLSAPPPGTNGATTQPGDVDPTRSGFNIKTPDGWAGYKASFDWIEERFSQYTKRGDVSQFLPTMSSLNAARQTLQSRALNAGTSDPFEGGQGSILAELGNDKVFGGSGWAGEAMDAFRMYIEAFGAREGNCVLVLESLWGAVDADVKILEMIYRRLVVIGNATIAALTNSSDGGGGYNLNSKITWEIAAAVAGITVASAATYLSAGTATTLGISIGLATAQGVAGIGGEAVGSDDVTNPKKKLPNAPTINGKGDATLKVKDIDVSGSDTQVILGDMLEKFSDMDQEVDSAMREVTSTVDTTYANVSKGVSGENAGEFAGQHPLVGPRPDLSKAGKSGNVKPLLAG